jgi:hypothetical protein
MLRSCLIVMRGSCLVSYAACGMTSVRRVGLALLRAACACSSLNAGVRSASARCTAQAMIARSRCSG